MKRIIFLKILFVLAGALLLSSIVLAQEESLLYSQDFESGQPEGWDLAPGWMIVESEGGHVLAGSGHEWASYTEKSWSDYRLRFRLKLNGDASLHANFRLMGSIRYFIGLNRENMYINKQTGPDEFSGNLASAGGLGSEWKSIEIAGYGPTITVSVDGQVVMEYTDPEPLVSGGIAFESLNDSQVWIDDVEIWGQAPTQAPTLEAGTAWVRTGGPLGGLGYDVRMRPDNPEIMFVTDAYAGVFKSTDGGQTWFPSNNGITTRGGASGDSIPIFCLTIDPHNPDIVWTGTQNVRGIFKSVDGGQTWVEKTNGIVEYEGITFRGISIDPHSSDIVYAVAEISSWAWAQEQGEQVGREFDKTKGVVYKSIDGGDNWTAIWRGDNLARYIWIDPRDSNVLYVSTGIFDREAANSDHTTNTPGGVGVLKSTDGGQTWSQINNGITNLYVGTLFMHPENPDILLAGSSNNAYPEGAGVFLTTDGGANWERTLQYGVQSVEFAATNPDIAYAGNPEFIYHSEDGGRNWQTIQSEEEAGWGPPGVEAGFPIDFQVDPRDPERIFANNYGGGNFMSEDGGVTWVVASSGYTGAQVRDITVSPDAPGEVYTAARSGIFGSFDGGGTWFGLNHRGASGLEWNAVAVDPTNPEHILAANNWYASIFQSQDGGENWQLTEIPRIEMQGWRVIDFAPSDPDTVYAGSAAFFSAGRFDANISASGIFVSQDGGSSWVSANDAQTETAHITDLAVHPSDSQTVYAASPNTGLFKTSDGGASWTKLDSLPQHTRPHAVVIHPSQTDTLFVGMELGGLYQSNDGGNTWQPITAGLPPEVSIVSILFNPTDSNQIFFGDHFSGVYRSTDGGQTWFVINEGLRTRAVNTLAFSSDGLHLYAATEGEGVYRLDLNGQPPEIAASIKTEPESSAETPNEPVEPLDEPTESLDKSTETPDESSEPPGEPARSLPCPSGFVPIALIGLVWVRRQRRRYDTVL